VGRRFIFAFMVLWAAGSGRSAGAFDSDAVEALRSGAAADIHDLGVYERFVSALEAAHELPSKDPQAFLNDVKRILDEDRQFQAYKMLGLALYSNGHAEEAALCSEVFEKRAIPVGEAIERVGAIVGGLEEAGIDPAVAADTRASMERLREAHAESQARQKARAADSLRLRNGQSVSGMLVERTEAGVWFETGPGERIFFLNEEVDAIQTTDGSEST
jgi:hypothetical protein